MIIHLHPFELMNLYINKQFQKILNNKLTIEYFYKYIILNDVNKKIRHYFEFNYSTMTMYIENYNLYLQKKLLLSIDLIYLYHFISQYINIHCMELLLSISYVLEYIIFYLIYNSVNIVKYHNIKMIGLKELKIACKNKKIKDIVDVTVSLLAPKMNMNYCVKSNILLYNYEINDIAINKINVMMYPICIKMINHYKNTKSIYYHEKIKIYTDEYKKIKNII